MKKSHKTKDKLIAATIESVYQHGYNDTTVAKISDLADTSLGTLHHYFSSKEDLLEQTMRSLLRSMHERLSNSTIATSSPRGKLWAVIEAVLGDEQAEDKTTAVWFAFWLQAEHDEDLRRLRDLYNRRLQSNVSSYLRQILQEIGASNVEDRVRGGTMMLISFMHGVWVSYALREELAQDLASARLLVWECLEMFLSRARESLTAEEATIATSAGLLSDVSIEIIGADMKKLPQWREYAENETPIYIPHFRNAAQLSDKVRMAAQLIDQQLKPVVHIAARNVQDVAELERTVAGMTGVGVEEFLLLGGGEPKPVGEFENVMQILSSGVLERHGVKRVGFAGHPEAHPDQPRDVMRRALTEKIVTAKALNMECSIVTQFCFAVRPFFDFLDWTKEQQFDVPVRLGIAGRVNAAKLIKFAAACGIGRSLTFVKRQFKKTMPLVNYSPEGLLAELSAGIAVREYPFPVNVHFYPFGTVTETLTLVSVAVMGSDSPATSLITEPNRH
ncbi:MAG: transcriptional regulator BetI [Proteobacteria bacterium]|nr:transcriptional regulator BetI [Pseudomonadota bacterium]